MPEKEAIHIQWVGSNGILYRLIPPMEIRNDWSSGFVGEKFVEYVVLVRVLPEHGRTSHTLVFNTIAMGDSVRIVALDAMCSSRQEDQALVLKELGYTLVETPKIEAEVVGNPMRIVRLED